MMAATIQTPTQQPPQTNNTSSTNPKLKRIVYSKYRELLGSYNDKANAIIESLPAYMVKEDRGFHFDPKIIDEVDNVVYGTPPAPPPLSAGSIPAQRLSTQVPQYNIGEAPACVQNAMMTKDKKPFTYTPGGIDLSQIKSQRMAKRLARNAQNEGTTGQQQMHRPTQSLQQSNGNAPVATAQLGATAMGMPFQVLPTGPPPPPPQPSKSGQPPPPPPAPQNKLTPQSNGNPAHTRRSPTPQNFEPPPMGFRPEIKIPPNPMAALKKVPPPQEKNNFWVEEYRKERSKSPMVGKDENDNNRSSPKNPQPETNQNTYNNYNNNNSSDKNEYQQQQNQYQHQQQQQQIQYKPQENQNQNSQENQYRAPASPQPMRQQQDYNTQRSASPPRTPMQQRRVESPYSSQPQQQSPSMQRQFSQQPISPQYQTQNSTQQQQSPTVQRQQSVQQQHHQQQQPQSPQFQRQQSATLQQSPQIQRQQTAPSQQYQSPSTPQYQQPQQQQTSPTQQQSVPWRSQRQVAPGIQNNVSRPRDVMSPAPSDSPRLQPTQTHPPAYLRSREAMSPAPELQQPQMSQPYQQKNAQFGSIYIPPVATQQQQQTPSYQQQSQQQQSQQQPLRQAPANRWMSTQSPSGDSQNLNRIKSPPPASLSGNSFNSPNNPGLKLQINNNTSNAKERIIPIQLEQTPTRTPSAAPGFGPQPFYNANQQQYSSVPSPSSAQGISINGPNSPNYVVRSPNQFVDQGYNQYTGSQDPNRVTSPPIQMQSPRVGQQTNTGGGNKTRIIPIAMETQPDGPLNPNNSRGPISQQPIVIQNDPRNQNAWGSGSATPTQSKSFRILQKITDTSDDGALESKAVESDGGDQEPQLQRPTYARQMSSNQVNSPTIEQMKRMQLNNDQAFANRVRNQDESEKSTKEDPRYRGPSNPSKTFKKLQGAVQRCSSPSKTDQNGASPVMKQPQPNRYVNQRPVYSPDEQSQHYVHPSEQQVPEPKIYTGSAIPSRSFKILQAMTTPENAAEIEDSDVVETNKSITECPCRQTPTPPSFAYSYPYMPPCCAPPPHCSSGGDVQNWQYPLAYHHPYPHHPPHQHPHQYPHHNPHQYHQCPPCPCYYYYPPHEYDSQNCNRTRDSVSRGRSQSIDLPNIIITPSSDDIPQETKVNKLDRAQREGSVIDALSCRLSEISKPADNDLNMSQEDDKKYVGDNDKEFNNSPSPNKSECENNKITSEDSSDDLLTSSSETSTTFSSEECVEEAHSDGLKAIKSVTNIQVYNKAAASTIDDDDRTIADEESNVFDEEEEEEEEIVVEELEYDEEEVLVEEMDSEEEEEEIEDFEQDQVIIMDDLSVIYEENESDLISPRPPSRVSSTISDSSTLANGEDEEEEKVAKVDEEDDENSNSVTVRLPLKFSFSRSSNDENVATIEVGSSQIEDKTRSFSIASISAEPDDYESDSQDCDVSVTISLSRSSGSIDKKTLSMSPVPPLVEDVIKEEIKENHGWESEDEDVSVSFSLPMRNKFMNQTWNGDITNNIAMEDTDKPHETEDTVQTWRQNNCIFDESQKSLRVESKLKEKCVEIRKPEEIKIDSHANKNNTETEKVKKSQESIKKSDSKVQISEDSSRKQKLLKSSSKMFTQDFHEDNGEKDTLEESQPTEENSDEELDFWATLQATRKEAQMFLEKTAGYWGKSIDGKDKPEGNQTEPCKTIEEENEHIFWSSIRVKNKENKTPEEDSQKKDENKDEKETANKNTKLKKKKKVVKKSEPQPDIDSALTTIKLPNAKNRSKIVESTIEMIKKKAKPNPLLKSLSREGSIESQKEPKKVCPLRSLSREDSTESEKVLEKEIIEKTVTEDVNKKFEEIKRKFVKEKAELKSQILNHKFVKAFVIPEKPPLMKAVLSEAETELVKKEYTIEKSSMKSVVSEVESNSVKEEDAIQKSLKTRSNIEIVIEEVAKPNKTKSSEESTEGDKLKPPKIKTIKKLSKESKKIKKKKEEAVNEENTLMKVQNNHEVMHIQKAEKEETDFWADIESSKSKATNKKQATDPWANIEVEKISSTAKEDYHCLTSQKLQNDKESKCDEEIDFWAEIESIKPSKEESKANVWAEINVSKIKKDEYKNLRKDTYTLIKIEPFEARYTEVISVNIPNTLSGLKSIQDTDFWAEINLSSQEVKEEGTKAQNTTENCFELDQNENITINSGINSEITKMEKSDPIEKKIKKKLKKSESGVDSEETKLKKKSIKPKEDTEMDKETDFTKPTKIKRKSSKDKLTIEDASFSLANSLNETQSTELSKPKTKKKGSKLSEEPNSKNEIEIITKTRKTSSAILPQIQTEPSDINQISQPTLNKKLTKPSNLHLYNDLDVEFISSQPAAVYYALHTEPETGLSLWATISYAEEEVIQHVVEEEEVDFWASINNNTESNSEVDTGKIDFWATQRKFQTNSGFEKEIIIENKNEVAEEIQTEQNEEPEEVDFWAEIKGPNDKKGKNTDFVQDECELRRNNYKKAMAFFTNTVEKNDDTPARSMNFKSSQQETYPWRSSIEPEWGVFEEKEENEVFLVIEDNEITEEEPDTLVENPPYQTEDTLVEKPSYQMEDTLIENASCQMEGNLVENPQEPEILLENCPYQIQQFNHFEGNFQQKQNEEEAQSESSESISDSTPNHFQIEHRYPIPEPEPIKPKSESIELAPTQSTEEMKISVKDRIFAFETGVSETTPTKSKPSLIVDSTTPKSELSRNSSQRSESEVEEDDSGVTDMNKPLSETDTESESFPELRKMSRYQRASTHSRLFKLLQDEGDVIAEEQPGDEDILEAEFNFKPRKKIVHNVSITRKQNPNALQEAESVNQRRQRLSLPLRKNHSIDADNPSSPNSPASPIHGQPSQAVSDKLVNELIQSLLLKKSSASLKNLPMEKLQAAAKRVLKEELDSLENTSLDSTPALTPQEFKNESYADYYDTWSSKNDSDTPTGGSFEILPSKAFKVLQETTSTAKRRPWGVRCPRVLSSKTVNRDLARVTESPEMPNRNSMSPEMFRSDRGSSVGRWKKI